eukprot:3713262-Amphidinium_carterae.1
MRLPYQQNQRSCSAQQPQLDVAIPEQRNVLRYAKGSQNRLELGTLLGMWAVSLDHAEDAQPNTIWVNLGQLVGAGSCVLVHSVGGAASH